MKKIRLKRFVRFLAVILLFSIFSDLAYSKEKKEEKRPNIIYIMAGGEGVMYYFGYAYPQTDLNCQDFRSRDNMFNMTRYALELLSDYQIPFQNMKNDQSLTSTGWCLAQRGVCYLIYIKSDASPDLDLSDYSGNFKVQWYNAKRGGSLQNGSISSVIGDGWRNIGTPPSIDDDWVAVVTKDTPPFMANGVKIGEVTSSQAIIWTRLTKIPDYETDGANFLNLVPDSDREKGGPEYGYCSQVPNNKTLEEMIAAVPGMSGEVRLIYWKIGEENLKETINWTAVNAGSDFTKQFTLQSLQPGTTYYFRVESRGSADGQVTTAIENKFSTAPDSNSLDRVMFTVVTGQMWRNRDDLMNGMKIYPEMAKLKPSFFVNTGDIVYYDVPSPMVTHIDLARYKWNRMYALPFFRDFHNQVPSYFMKDDHDSWQNDGWPTMQNTSYMFTWEQGRNTFLEQIPMGEKTYRTVRWGKDLQIWFVEGRDFRSPNTDPDGPDKTIWGEEQIQWFKKTVKESDATFRILISPTPIVGPDHAWKAETSDNHIAVSRAYEGDMLRKFISKQKNMYVICGDRRWQYVSEHTETGLWEYSCGPTTDRHSAKLDNDDRSMLRYLREEGGFLSVTIERIDSVPIAIFRHHSITGVVCNEDIRSAF